MIVKRVVALEGDIVKPRNPKSLRHGGFMLMGGGAGGAGGMFPGLLEGVPSVVKIPKGHCWVESDESYHGMDSNTFGPVPLGLVYAKVSWIIWPLERWGKVRSFIPNDASLRVERGLLG
jgi:inner membrane protease subunit 2